MKILVAYDGSAYARKALDEAIDIAQKFNGRLIILHVGWDVSENESRRILLEAEGVAKEKKVKHTLRTEWSEYTPRRIIRVAMDEAVDLIAIGSRGLGAKKGWVLGSVSSRVVEESPVPVPVVK